MDVSVRAVPAAAVRDREAGAAGPPGEQEADGHSWRGGEEAAPETGEEARLGSLAGLFCERMVTVTRLDVAHLERVSLVELRSASQ